MQTRAISLTPVPWIGIAAAVAVCLLNPLQLAAAAGTLALAGLALVTLARGNRWVPMFLVAALCLPPLPFAIGDSGPHVALVVAGLGVAAGVIRWCDWGAQLPAEALALLVFPLLLLLGIPLAVHYSGSLIAAQSLARVFLFAISMYIFF